MRHLLASAILFLLAACSAEEVAKVQGGQAAVQAAISGACADVNAANALAAPFSIIPQVGAIMDYGTAACGGATAVAALVTKAVNDPTTVAWTQNLAAQIKAAIPAKS
jgi:hypothetical protein